MVTKKKKPPLPKKKPSKRKTLKAPWMKTAYSLLDTQETPGRKNNAEIMGWAAVVGGKTFRTFTADSIPWCGLYVAYCLAENGIKPPTNPLWARDYAGKWGINLEKKSAPPVGAVLTFKRGKGGHVGFCVGMSTSKRGSGYYYLLSGNTSDEVNVSRIAKSRCIGWRWPKGMSKFLPKTPAPVMSLANAQISTNEA